MVRKLLYFGTGFALPVMAGLAMYYSSAPGKYNPDGLIETALGFLVSLPGLLTGVVCALIGVFSRRSLGDLAMFIMGFGIAFTSLSVAVIIFVVWGLRHMPQ